MRGTTTFTYDNYKAGDAWFICDRCGQRHRRSKMLTEWTGLKVDAKCLDPRPPQMTTPSIFPEGIPFPDARPPQDNADRMQDQTTISGFPDRMPGAMIGGPDEPFPPGALSPLQVTENPFVENTNTVADDYTIITGPVPAPSVDDQ